MNVFEPYLNKPVEIELSGERRHAGILIDIGQDILVLYNGKSFLYIPFLHIQHVQADLHPEAALLSSPAAAPIDNENSLSYRKILQNARGLFAEIFVSGNQSLHGYVTSILTNYFVFYSPVFKTMYIPMNHLKWLIPYTNEQTPYSIDKNNLPVNPSTLPLSRTFEEQVARLQDELVIFDLGINPNKIGLLKKIHNNNIVELVTAEEKHVFWNIQHIKSVHSPKLL